VAVMRDLAWGKPSDKITIPTQSVDSNHLVIIQFFDSCQSLLSSRGLSNWFFSVFFFLMMTLNSLSNFIYLVASPNVANTISRITCFAPRIDPNGEAILLARVLLFKTAGNCCSLFLSACSFLVPPSSF
jgi:hypothetical protein